MRFSEKKGFTLIETVVAGILVSVLALGLISLFIVYTRDVAELTAYFKMQRDYDGLMDELGRNIRAASLVVTPTEFESLSDPEFSLAEAEDITSKTVILLNSDSSAARAYRLSNHFVEVSENGGDTWKPFSVGGSDTIWLSDRSLNTFYLASTRMNVQLDLTLRTVIAGDTTDLNVERGTFLCRL